MKPISPVIVSIIHVARTQSFKLTVSFVVDFLSSSITAKGASLSGLKDWAKKLAEPAVMIPALVGLLTGGGGALLGHLFWRASNLGNAAVAISDPATDGTIQRCITVSGTATLPVGDSIWIVIQGHEDQRYYLEGSASTNPIEGGNVTWRRDGLTVGSSKESGTQYQIYAIILNSATAAYLDSMTIIASSKARVPIWEASGSADTLPPNLLAVASAVETRDNSADNCHHNSEN